MNARSVEALLRKLVDAHYSGAQLDLSVSSLFLVLCYIDSTFVPTLYCCSYYY